MTKDSGEFSNVANRFKEKKGGRGGAGGGGVEFFTRLYEIFNYFPSGSTY